MTRDRKFLEGLQGHTRDAGRRFLLPCLLFLAGTWAVDGMLGKTAGILPLALGMALALLLSLPKRRIGIAGAVLALCGLSMAFFPVREGAKLLLNRLFSASAAVNRYAYAPLAILAVDAEAAETLFDLTISGVEAALAVLAAEKGWFAALLAMLWAGVETYFGVTPGNLQNAALFLALAWAAAGLSVKGAAKLTLGTLLLCLAIGWAVPGVHAPLEAASEHVRDRLSQALSPGGVSFSGEEDSVNAVRQESLLREQEADVSDESRAERAYEKHVVYRRDISAPKTRDFLKTALLLLLLAALLAAPFVPFYLWDARRKKLLAARQIFAAPDAAAAVRAMFPHIVRCLSAAGLAEENAPYSALCEKISALFSADYAQRYAAAVPIWQEAAYSDHVLPEEARQAVRDLLLETERLVWGRADRRTRLRLKVTLMPEGMP